MREYEHEYQYEGETHYVYKTLEYEEEVEEHERNLYWLVKWDDYRLDFLGNDPNDGVFDWFDSQEYFIFDFEEN